jgi:threonine dehydratase
LFADIKAAAARLEGVANRTPVMSSRTFAGRIGAAAVYFKCENFQRGGAFKFRGAYNHIASLSPQERANGVVAASSGNHAQGVALAARLLGIPALIIMPSDAPTAKLAATRVYGAEVSQYDRLKDRPELLLAQFASERGMHPVPAFDDPLIMAGQGTAALELVRETGPLHLIVVPTGGGGLLSGTATAVRSLSPRARIFGVEPQAGNDWVQSLAAGERVLIDPPDTIADGARTRQPGALPFTVVRELVDGVVTVSDTEIVEALRFLTLRMKLVVEPTGALAAAALLAGRLGDLAGLRVGAIISGGNIDPDALAGMLAP